MTSESNAPLTIAYLYPQWKSGRHSYAMDVLGRGLARSMSGSHAVEMVAKGSGSEAADGMSIRFVGRAGDRVLMPPAFRLWPVAERLGLIPDSRPINSTIWAFPGYAVAAARHVRRIGADVAHIHIYEQLAPVVKRASPSTAVVLHMHDHSQLQQAHAVVRRRLTSCDLIVGCSEYLTNAARERFPDLADRMVAIPNSLPDPVSGRPRAGGDASILFIGRLSPEKGVHLLVQAFNRVASAYPSATLTLVGPGAVPSKAVVQSHLDSELFADVAGFYGKGTAFRDHLEDLVEPRFRDRVEFAGEMRNDEATSRLLEADVLVLPSIWNEPFGMPILEAMAAGLPVVASRRGAFPDTVVEGETGLLVSPGNVDELADALRYLLDNPDAATAMGKAGRARATGTFGWDDYVRTWESLYRRLLRQ